MTNKFAFSPSMWRSLVGICFALFCMVNAKSPHEQVHIALGSDETEIVVTWATKHHQKDQCIVQFGTEKSDLKHVVKAETNHFSEGGASFYTHRALLHSLNVSTIYYYRVGTKNAHDFSETFYFRTLPSGNKWLPKFAVYGDLGYQNEQSLPYLSKDVEKDMYDVIFHIGDFAYDLNGRHGEQGNDFMRSIEKVAAQVPYMTCPGNHEEHANFSHYDSRFSMIGNKHDHSSTLVNRLNNHFHSMNIGPAHIVMFSTEYYYYTKFGWDQIERQYHWLEEDLKRANLKRSERPWIIVMGHRPLYCLKMGDSSCDHETLERKSIRQGIHMHDDKKHLKYGLEELFFKYGVDIQLYGHEHFYARMLPIYNYTIKAGAHSNPYENANAPIHITTGSAGNREEHPNFNPIIRDKKWVADHQLDYGYTRLLFKDRFHISVEQTSDDQHGKVTDHFDIIKHNNHPTWLL